jgi:uncharacterized damage-inducible protein DinB
MTPKEQFLAAYDREHQITTRVLRAYPPDKLDLQPHPKTKTARDLAWVFAIERGLGTRVWNDEFAKGAPAGSPPPAPERWEDLLAAIEKAHQDFRALVASASDETLMGKVHFFTAPKTMGEITRLDLLWFLLSDEIHHRGQFSIYLRMADGKVPSIYGPSADEPWM